MSPSTWSRLDLLARSLFPFALTLLLVMAGMVPLPVPGLSPIVPSLGLIAVYYWVIHRPDLMPIWAIFLIGVVHDLLAGGPLGASSLVFLAVHAVIAAQRRVFAGASFFLIWTMFLPLAGAAILLSWVLHCLVAETLIDPNPAAFQFLTTAAVYPCCAWLFGQAQRSLLR